MQTMKGGSKWLLEFLSNEYAKIPAKKRSFLKGVKKQIFSSGPTGCRTDLPLKLAVKYHPACFS
jgi:hypothetical protein